jgi:pimeloyl-ACP methyl ester carboxylesterase
VPLQRLPTGVELYYETHGTGEPLVFIPATGFAGNVWLPDQVPELSESLQVIIFDPRGSGRSSRPHTVYTIEQMARDTLALLDQLGLPAAHVLGHSMGGRIGLALALDFPGRVKSLILAASGSGVVGYPAPANVAGLPEQLARDVAAMGLEGYVRHEIFETSTYFTDAYRARESERVQRFFDLAWEQHAALDTYFHLCVARHRWEATHRLGDVTVPTLVVIGEGDVVGRSHVPQAELLAQRIPGAEFKVLPNQCHGFFWEAPRETNAWIREWVMRKA